MGGLKYKHWLTYGTAAAAVGATAPKDFTSLRQLLADNRRFEEIDELHYGDHGLHKIGKTIVEAIRANKKIALYADYDVDGTMSCASWIWFFQALKYPNYMYYIPCRFKEGYGLNIDAMKHLVQNEKVDLIITMDTGITANEEAAYCKEHGVDFICTDHHVIQEDKMPDCKILNPKQHPDPNYQELCGAGITFVLLRHISKYFPTLPKEVWQDILAIAGMATIADMVTLNAVNHKLARLGVKNLVKSERPVLRAILDAIKVDSKTFTESDIGFQIAPRINSVGRLEHAEEVVKAFCDESSDPSNLVKFMTTCNEKRKAIQKAIIASAGKQAKQQADDPVLFLGGDYHSGVVGVAATRIADDNWKPTFIYDSKKGRGSARSMPARPLPLPDGTKAVEFNITEAMLSVDDGLFRKAGGHAAAGGFSFNKENGNKIREQLIKYANKIKKEKPKLWESKAYYDCELPAHLCDIRLVENVLDTLRPFGIGFPEPTFLVKGKVIYSKHYKDKQTGKPAHTMVMLRPDDSRIDTGDIKIMIFNKAVTFRPNQKTQFLVTAQRDAFNKHRLSFIAKDFL